MIQVFMCLEKYFSVPTYISSYITDQNKADFPEITFCKEGNSYKQNVLRVHGILNEEHYSGTKAHLWSSNASSLSPKMLFSAATYSVKDLMETFYIRTINTDENGSFGF